MGPCKVITPLNVNLKTTPREKSYYYFILAFLSFPDDFKRASSEL